LVGGDQTRREENEWDFEAENLRMTLVGARGRVGEGRENGREMWRPDRRRSVSRGVREEKGGTELDLVRFVRVGIPG